MSLRSVVPALLLVLTFFVASDANAGYYAAPVYSGGTETINGKSVTNAFGSAGGGYGCGMGGGTYSTAPGPAAPFSMVIAGPLTAKFLWQPAFVGDLAPAYVSVQRTCSVSAMITIGPPATCTPTYSNGLGVSTPANPVSSTSYTVQSPAADGSVSVLCSPSLNITGSNGSTGFVAAIPNVTYSANISPVTLALTLGGTTPDANGDGNLNILVGQGCSGKLTGVPVTPGATVSYAWTVSGTTFQSWTVTQNLTAKPPTSTAAAILGPGPLTNSTAHWYWNDPIVSPNTTTETVTCTATVTPPAGQGNAFNLIATKKVIVQVPAWQAAGRADYMQVNALKPDDSNPELWAGPTSADRANHLGVGMLWQATVATPTVPAFGNGSLELIQIVTPNDSYTLATPPQQYNDPLNGIKGLDLTYPYGEVYTEAPNSSFTDNDSPGIPLFGEGKNGTSVAASASFASKYIDYLMYRPPGSDTQWVALGQYSWNTSGSATIPTTNNWADYASQHNGSDSAGTISPAGVTMFGGVMGPAFYPTWTVLDISMHYPAP